MRTDVKIGVAVGLCFVIAFIFYYVIGTGNSDEPQQEEQTTPTAHLDDGSGDTGGQDETGTPGGRHPGFDPSPGTGSSILESGREDPETDVADSGLSDTITDDSSTDPVGRISVAILDEEEEPAGILGRSDTSSESPGASDGDRGLEDSRRSGSILDRGADTVGDEDDVIRPRTDSSDSGSPGSSLLDRGRDGPGSTGDSSLIERYSQPGDPLPTEQGTWHEVRDGETLSDISRTFYGDTKYYRDILAANPDVEEYSLRPGTRLRIPPISEVVRSAGPSSVASGGSTSTDLTLPSGWKAHKIASGDTLGALSQQYYGSTRYWEAIQKANTDINPRSLPVGRVLKIPPREQVVPTSSSSRTARTPRSPSTPPIEVPTGWKVHTVQEGDMLSTISQQYYGTSRFWPLLAEKNPEINPNNMKIGEQIRIPPRPAGDAPPIPVPTTASSETSDDSDPDSYSFPKPILPPMDD
jgi:nucleoid-associated protein YgaU